MAKEIDVEKALYPKKDVLRVDKESGTISTTIVDAELDGIECTFNNDGSVQLETEGYSYITLSVDNLLKLVELIEKAERKYEKILG